uniref:Adenosyl-chloride synthase n=1 Tax=Candidatus Kentrum eta TaxID=2126337 RepID=A0A450UTE3_9GAMM|nr:MAG: hypothetical protein BECKH772A_GA0070896_1009212 [Candidatus Kentron sp. H]VFK00850.1 MAG: hypothetical protein BECKH772B_GA0070898_102073 [Candidatus Kentron sp. H]VFK04753.1 MAG: hypothetical protein BECKH772C_GA0070978_102043 [Candidatus Kentron sp. H]
MARLSAGFLIFRYHFRSKKGYHFDNSHRYCVNDLADGGKPLIVLFTDFGITGPYVGQVKAALLQEAPGVPIVDLMHDIPAFNPKAAAYLLAALVDEFPYGTTFLCVVDPGVGTESRLPVVLAADGQWFVGPNNGVFSVVAKRSQQVKVAEITWQPHRLSASFHARDLFAPVAAMVARGESVPAKPMLVESSIVDAWPEDLPEIIYIDHFGNAMTGLRYAEMPDLKQLIIGDTTLYRAHTFGRVPEGQGFWYENANGLIEIAVNQGSVALQLGLSIGTPVRF